jgi:hypothetical protein
VRDAKVKAKRKKIELLTGGLAARTAVEKKQGHDEPTIEHAILHQAVHPVAKKVLPHALEDIRRANEDPAPSHLPGPLAR